VTRFDRWQRFSAHLTHGSWLCVGLATYGPRWWTFVALAAVLANIYLAWRALPRLLREKHEAARMLFSVAKPGDRT
jgi:hypothetical protein